MKNFLVLLLSVGSSAHAAGCPRYSTPVILHGTLSRHTFAEQPNYESIAQGDAKASYFFLSPNKALCVAEGTNTDGLEPPERRVARVQLVFTDGAVSYRRLRPYLGKEVVCRGSFFHAITGHHHSAVLLDRAQCRPAHPPRKPAQ